MDRRRLLLILAIFVAVIGTGLVFLYVKGADSRAEAKIDSVTVLKATTDIAAGESYDSAYAAGKIKLQNVPRSQVEGGSQTSADTLKGKIASVPIYTGQQIITNQFGSSVKAPTSNLAIPKGKIAISVNLTDPDRVAGNIQSGSQVAIFVTGDLKSISASGAPAGATGDASVQATRLLLPKVTVLNVGSPVPTSTTTTDTTGAATTETLPRTLLTLAVTQSEAEKIIVSSKALDLTFGLTTSTSSVHPSLGTSTLISSLFK